MKKIVLIFVLTAFAYTVFVHAKSSDPIDFWKSIPRGANMTSYNPIEDFNSYKNLGGKLIRFGATGSPADFTFLIKGSGANEEFDLSKSNLDRIATLFQNIEQRGLFGIVTLSDIPGRRWRFRKRDCRIWASAKFQDQFVGVWKTLAQALRNSKNIVGYDLMNEPYLPHGKDCKDIKATPQDLRSLYQRTIGAIRKIDITTPIILESPGMASRDALDVLPIIADERVIYSFHYYEPYAYYSAAENQGKLSYPGTIPLDTGLVKWDIKQHRQMLQTVVDWQKKNSLPSFRIYVGEFGMWRKAKGADSYLKDLTLIFAEHNWPWTYYSFRENEWDNTDLEKVGINPVRTETDLFRVIQEQFQ